MKFYIISTHLNCMHWVPEGKAMNSFHPNETNNLKMGKFSLTLEAPCFPKKGIWDCTQSLQSHTERREQDLSHFHQPDLRYKERLILPN